MLELFWLGGWIMWPILACSLVGTTIFFERFGRLRAARIREHTVRAVCHLVADRAPERAVSLLDSQDHPEGPCERLLREALALGAADRETLETILAHGVDREIKLLTRHFGTLTLLSSLAPLLGFLGTVTGMIQAFQVLQNMGGRVNAAVLAGGIWEAMLTTAFGLMVAIPLVLMVSFLESRLRGVQIGLEEVAVAYLKAWAAGRRERPARGPGGNDEDPPEAQP
ncbi:MAG: MotA/TolQ/ExbB proton channel family protein [Thermodesulfobacteriota bacterium]